MLNRHGGAIAGMEIGERSNNGFARRRTARRWALALGRCMRAHPVTGDLTRRVRTLYWCDVLRAIHCAIPLRDASVPQDPVD